MDAQRGQGSKGRSTEKVLLRQNVGHEVEADECQDSQGPEQPYKQEP